MRTTRPGNPVRSFFIAVADGGLVAGSFVAAGYLTLPEDPQIFLLYEGGGQRVAALTGMMVAAFYVAGLYAPRPGASRIYRAQQLSLAAGIALLFEAFLSWVAPDAILPRNLTIMGIAMATCALLVWRTLLDAALRRFSGPGTILLLGGGATLQEIAEYAATHPEANLAVAGSLASDPASAVAPILGKPEDLQAVYRDTRPDLIVAGTDASRRQFRIADLIDLRFSGAAIREAGAACELVCHRVSARDLPPWRVLFTTDFEPRSGQIVIPVADRIISGLLLVVGAPVALGWALLLAVSGNQVMLREKCAGFRGALFTSRHFGMPEWGALTEAALAIRLDRYPDLWNVLAGRMSMVGPRPIRVEEDRDLMRSIPVYEYRRNVKPGIASWAHLHAEMRRPAPDALREVEYDLYYVRYQSPTLYAFVLLHGFRPRMS